MRVISRKKAGVRPVYDIGVPQAHNFVLENGTVAHNCFNKSHSISYSAITYMCAWLKANYPAEFFCSLMTIRSQGLSPKLWAQKAPEYIHEAKMLGIKVHPPTVNESVLGFSIHNDEVYFGLNAIRDVGKTAARSIIRARRNTPFQDIFDFLTRVNRQKVTRKVFLALVKAGAFDRMGYARDDLENEVDTLYKYLSQIQVTTEQLVKIAERIAENEHITTLIEERDDLRKKLKASQRKRKPGPSLNLEEEDRLQELEEMKLRRKPKMKDPKDPEEIKPSLARSRHQRLTIKHLLDQASMIGCFTGPHPAGLIFPEADRLHSVDIGQYSKVAGMVSSIKTITTRRGQPMAFMELEDGSGVAEIILFPSVFKKLQDRDSVPEAGQIVLIEGKCETIDPITKVICNKLVTYRG